VLVARPNRATALGATARREPRASSPRAPTRRRTETDRNEFCELQVTVAATGSAVYAWQQLKTNEAFLNATFTRATEIVDEAVAHAEKYNLPRSATLRLLGKAERSVRDMARYGRPTPELRYRKVWMLIRFARNYAILGDTSKRFARADEAYRLLAGLAAEKPDDIAYQWDLSVAFAEVGDTLMLQGNLPEALQAHRDGLAIMVRLAKGDPGNEEGQRDLSVLSYPAVATNFPTLL
jgi:hypothetical protein